MASAYKRGKKWTAVWKDENGQRRTRSGYTDKAQTLRLARQLEDHAKAISDGLDSLADRKRTTNARRPLKDHLTDFRGYLESKRNTPEHVGRVCSFITDAMTACQWTSVRDIDPEQLADRLATLAKEGLSPRARNARLQAGRQFTRWLLREHRATADPLSAMRPVRETDDRRVQRRALSPEEVAILLGYLDGAGDVVTIPKRYRYKRRIIDGVRNIRIPHRAALYRVMLGTGFRVAETKSLRARDFHLDASPPFVQAQAAYTKNRCDVSQPIRRDLGEAIRPLIESSKADAALWPSMPSNMAPIVRADMEAARAAWIAEARNPGDQMRREQSETLRPVNGAGRRIDAHALRHTYITTLAKANIAPRIAQELARHSDPRLTANIYSHIAITESASALEALPGATSRTQTRAAG